MTRVAPVVVVWLAAWLIALLLALSIGVVDRSI